MKKALILLLTIVLVAGTFSGCGTSSGSGTSSPSSGVSSGSGTSAPSSAANSAAKTAADTSGISAPGKYPITAEKSQLTIFATQSANITNYDDNALTKWMEEQTNVKVTWQLTPSNDRDQKLNLMLASGDNLADVIMGGVSTPMIVDYATQGLFVNLTKLIDEQAVNLQAAFTEYPGSREICTAPDGKLYSMPSINDVLGNKFSGRMWVNRPWLNKLGLDVPKNTDEFANMLRAFRDRDPNGNGKKDEIPMMGSTDGWAGTFDRFLINSFIRYDGSKSKLAYNVINGKITPVYDTEAYRDALRYMAMLVSEGLYDTASFTQTNNQLKAILETKAHAMIGALPSGGPTTFGTTGSARKIDYEPISPLKGPKGVQIAFNEPYTYLNVGQFIVTSKCKNPAIAVKWADLLYTADASMRARWGPPEVGYKQADPGALDAMGRPAKWQSLIPWGSENNVYWGGNHPQLINFLTTTQGVLDKTGTAYPKGNDRITEELYIKYAPPLESILPPMMYDAVNSARLNEIESALKPYVWESQALFVTGRMNIEKDWDKYLDELKKMGYKEAVEIMQKRFDQR